MKTTIILLSSVIVHAICAQTLTPKSIALYKTDTLQAPQSSCDHFPFLQLDMSESTNTFLLAFCEYDIAWASTTNEKETVKHNFTELSLVTASGKSVEPVGQFTTDQRLGLINNPKHVRVVGHEAWGATTVRFGALFLIDRNEEEFTISFAGTKHKATVTTDPLPHPADLAKITVIESKLADSIEIDPSSRFSRTLPGVKSTLSTDTGKLLLVKVDVTPQAPNVMGGELRYIYRPSDFMLIDGARLQRPLGFTSGNFGMDTIYNVSRTTLDELQKVNNGLTLVFAVGDDYKTGTLTFLGKPQGEVATP